MEKWTISSTASLDGSLNALIRDLITPQQAGILLSIANMVLYFCSDKAGFITGENICIDGGMTRQIIYYNNFV